MSDPRSEGVNLLNPELKAAETEAEQESLEQASGLSSSSQETSGADHNNQLAQVKASLDTQSQTQALSHKDPVLQDIENILSENIADIYARLPEAKQVAFKTEGEKLAGKIRDMILKAKVQIHKVLKLLTLWLRIIPGVNVYFLKQEAKIKLDKIVDYAGDYKTKHNQQV